MNNNNNDNKNKKNKLILSYNELTKKENKNYFLQTVIITIFTFILLSNIEFKYLGKYNFLLNNKIIIYGWFIFIFIILVKNLKFNYEKYDIDKKNIENIKNVNNKFINYVADVIISKGSLKIVGLLFVLIFVQLYMKARKIKFDSINSRTFSHNWLTIAWFTTFFVIVYISLLPNNNELIHFIKNKSIDAIIAYLIAVLGFYGVPLPVYWLVLMV